MTLSAISKFFQGQLPLLEKYWLSSDKQKFIESITNHHDKELLTLLVNPLPDNYEEVFKRLKIPSNVRTELLQSKLLQSLRDSKEGEQKQHAISKYVEEYFKNLQFDYPKPVQTTTFVQSATTEVSKPTEDKSTLILQQSLQKHLQQLIEQDYRNFQTLSEFGIKQLKEDYLMNLHVDNKKYLIEKREILNTFSDDFIAKFLVSYAQPIGLVRKVPFHQLISSAIINSLSQSQINTLKELKGEMIDNSAFANKWFQLNYLSQIELDNFSFKKSKMTLKQMDERRKTLISIHEEIQKVDSKLLKPFENHLFYEILVLDLKREDPKKKLFLQFLDTVEGVSSFFNKEFRQIIHQKYGRKSISEYSAICSANLLCTNFRVETLITQYLKKMFRKYKNSEQLKLQLSKYLDFNIVNSFYARVKLQEGEEVPNLSDVLPKHEVEELKKSKEITILAEKTGKYFKSEDDVTLTIRIKNIKQIKLKVYEMNMEQFYLQNPEGCIDETINLQYLNPTHQELIEIQAFKNSFQVIEQELSIDKIEKGCGFYIVELVGEGITSRAVIRKGAIACFEENHIDGKLLKFYDEAGNPISNIKIWIDGRCQVLPEAEYLIPFNKNTNLVHILAVRENYVQKFEIYLSQEVYSFQVGMIYNHESFIVGKKSKVILHPVLKLGSEKVSLENMKNVRVTANLINNQNIRSSEKFDNLKFTDEKDYVLEVPIKSYTRSIQVIVEGEVKDLDGQEVKLDFRKTLVIELIQGTTNFIDIYLNRTNKGKSNKLKVRGLNGQSMQNLDVTLSLTLYGTSKEERRVLKTNSKGEINLGSLQYAKILTALINTSYGAISRTWNLWEVVDEVSYLDQQLIYHEDDSVTIPLPFSWNINQNNLQQFLNFTQIMNGNIEEKYENKINQVKIVNQYSSNYLHFGKLPQGVYELKFLMIEKTVSIRIVSGKKWPNGSIFNDKFGTFYKISQSPLLFVTIGEAKEEKGEKQNTKKLTIPINIPEKETQDLESIRIHIILKNNQDSFDKNKNQTFLIQNYNQSPNVTTQQLTNQQSNYYNNKPLSDEQAYVINRENQKQFIGNNLQKPRIFLKRIEVRDTTQIEQNLAKQGAYNLCDDDMYGGGGGGGERCFNAARCAPYGDGRQGYVLMNYNLNSHNNFFALSGHSILNCKFKKQIQLIIPEGYSEAIVYLITQDSAIRKTFYLESQVNEKKKDLKHCGLQEKEETTGWSMSRQIYQLQKGEKRQISRDSIWCTVSLSNILQFAQIKGYKLPEWISQWKSYSEEKKLEVYDKEVCHEMNVFIKHQDKDFFQKIIEPFIRNKITKTFVDLCILEEKSVLEYASPHKIQTLNEFEKVLLIENLMKNEMKTEAKNIAASMQLQQKSVKRSFQAYKELFDIVLNSQASSPKPKASQPMRAPQALFGMAPSSSLRMSEAKMSSNSFAMFGAPPPMTPQMMMMMQPAGSSMNRQMQQEYGEVLLMNEENQFSRPDQPSKKKRKAVRESSARKYKPGFKEVEKTKQYTETTYAGMKNPKLSTNLIQKNLFWAHIATYLTSEESSKTFLSEAFLYFTLPIEFTLACCFISSDSHSDYELSNQGDNFVIQANNSFMLFVKEVKELNYADKFGVLINQRFFNPQERFTFEDDGTKIEKLVNEFLVKKPYTLQTVVTNTSGTNLQLQLLMDIPSGAIPLMSHEYVQIINANINSFSTTSFERQFYFPSQGTSTLYPANASRNNAVISKAKRLPQISVKLTPTVNKMESFSDVMRSGQKKEILDYIEKRNIFDPNIFSPYSILWMLKDKAFFEQVIEILRRRNYFDSNLWVFGIYHKDVRCIMEYIEAINPKGLKSAEIPIFEYFPYFSRRTHKFLDESKSTIRNIQFKETYNGFIVNSLLGGQFSSFEKVAFAYYLLLQDRIDECAVVFKSMTEEERKWHQIQTDYLACYLSMYQDYPNFTIAETISQKYQNYPISTWNQMFKEIFDTLKEYREDIELQEETVTKRPSSFTTTFLNQAENIKLNLPEDTKVEVYFYDLNLELYFSDYPFEEIQSLSVVKPKVSKVFPLGASREQKILFSEVSQLGNMIVQIYEFKEGVPALKIGSFFWANPKIKVKISQNQGTLQVFYDGKKQTGCYVKVYSMGTSGSKFYRDGYTDITGKFKYALADLEGLSKFSILTITKQGGVISQVNPPSTLGHY